MNTFKFEKVDGSRAKFTPDGIRWLTFDEIPLIESYGNLVILHTRGKIYYIDISKDHVEINGIVKCNPGTVTISTSSLHDAISVLFPKANSSSGGTALNLDATVDGATRYAMTAEQKAFLDNLMAVNNPSNI